MLARTTTIQADVARIDDGIAYVRDEVTPAITALDGCARVTWMSGDPDSAERAADLFRMVILPRVPDNEGFCSASLLINRDTGCGEHGHLRDQ